MHRLRQNILDSFQEDNSTQTTTDLVQTIFTLPEDVNIQQKAKHHRKLLYHINKLLEEGTLVHIATNAHGEKAYSIHNQNTPSMFHLHTKQYTTNYIQQEIDSRIVHTIVSSPAKVEAVALHSSHYKYISHIVEASRQIRKVVEDAICIYDFQSLLYEPLEDLKNGISELAEMSSNDKIAFTLQVTAGNTGLRQEEIEKLTHLVAILPKRIYLIINGHVKDMERQQQALAQIAHACAVHRVKCTLQNTGTLDPCMFTGRAGTYKITKNQMSLLLEHGGAVISSSSMLIDFGKITHKSPKEIRELALNCARQMLVQTALQRRVAHLYLQPLEHVGSLKKLLFEAKHYLRIWNYDVHTFPHIQFLESIKEQIEHFCTVQRKIFLACGVPLEFDILISSAFPHYAELSKRTYVKRPILSRNSFKTQELELREGFLRVYDCDRVRFFRDREERGEALLSELILLLKTYNIPMLTYDFNALNTTSSLTEFMQ